MFLFKKLVGPLLFPLPLASFLLLLGLALLWFTRRQKAGKLLVSAGTFWLVSMSFGIFAPWTLVPLERQYQPLLTTASITTPETPVKWIVVLGGGGAYSAQIPSASQLSPATLARLIEGIRLQRQLPGSKLILSEGNIFDSVPVADLMGSVAQELGVASDAMILERQSQDTEGQAQLVRPMVGNDRFILVTSAAHMPRSIALFRKVGLNPIAAPTDYGSYGGDGLRPSSFYPTANKLRKAELAMHEYMGLAWAKIRGRI
jgi:uncharacterized SAM-binding protein YcdF (DUF218 family)